RREKGPREARVVHADAELEAGKTGLRDLEQRGPDTPLIAYHGLHEIDAFDGEILAEQPRWCLDPDMLAPEVVVFARLRIHGPVRAAVHGAVGLVVAGKVDATNRDSAFDGRLPDRGRDQLALPLHFAHLADVHPADASC